jgi:hypothetical protein
MKFPNANFRLPIEMNPHEPTMRSLSHCQLAVRNREPAI